MKKQESREEPTLSVKGVCGGTFLHVGLVHTFLHPGTAFKRRASRVSACVCMHVCVCARMCVLHN